uniref:3'-5' exonuclease domain-containing protein n=1 Tax=Oryza glaberrima TaxID=4538 RepID=I1QE10_ORYGL
AVADDPSAAAAATPPPPQFPTVTLLQVACRGDGDGGGAAAAEVFVVDLLAVPLAELREPLRELFERPEVLKLGFRFKQDLVYLSATFAAALGSSAGFERVEPFLDVTNVYYYLKGHDMQKRLPRETKSLATICEELLGVYLSKSLAIYARAIESAYQSFHGIQSHTPIALTLKVPGEIETG